MQDQLSCDLLDELLGDLNASPDSAFMDACHAPMDACHELDTFDTAADVINAFQASSPVLDVLDDQEWSDLVSCIGSVKPTANKAAAAGLAGGASCQCYVIAGQHPVTATGQQGAQWQQQQQQQQQQQSLLHHHQQQQSACSLYSWDRGPNSGAPAAAAATTGSPYVWQGSNSSSSASWAVSAPHSGLVAAETAGYQAVFHLVAASAGYQAACQPAAVAETAAAAYRVVHDPAAAAAAAAQGMPVPCTGLFAHAQSPAQVVAVTSRAQRLLGDLVTHLNNTQQQQQQQQQVDPANALAAWLQAAWYLEVLSSGAVAAAASPAATTQAIAAAKVAGADTGTPDRPLLQLLEQLLLLLMLQAQCGNMFTAAIGPGCVDGAGGSGGGAAASSVVRFACVSEVVRQLQQGLSVVQGLAAAADQRAAVSCKGLLQSYLVARYRAAFPGDVAGRQQGAQMVMQLAALL